MKEDVVIVVDKGHRSAVPLLDSLQVEYGSAKPDSRYSKRLKDFMSTGSPSERVAYVGKTQFRFLDGLSCIERGVDPIESSIEVQGVHLPKVLAIFEPRARVFEFGEIDGLDLIGNTQLSELVLVGVNSMALPEAIESTKVLVRPIDATTSLMPETIVIPIAYPSSKLAGTFVYDRARCRPERDLLYGDVGTSAPALLSPAAETLPQRVPDKPTKRSTLPSRLIAFYGTAITTATLGLLLFAWQLAKSLGNQPGSLSSPEALLGVVGMLGILSEVVLALRIDRNATR